MKLTNVTFGTDPEFVIVEEESNIPAQVIDFIPGSKKEPFDIGNGCGIQPDNVMIESTQPPTNNKKEFINYIKYCKETAEKILLQNTNKKYKVVSLSSAFYSPEDLEHPIAKKFGCEPSFCIHTQSVSHRPTPEEIGTLRSAGFHLHIGFDGIASIEDIEFIVFLCDIFLGLGSVILDSDTERRKLYGNAGDFRSKEILKGSPITIVEYRTLGGAMHRNEEIIGWCFDQLQLVVETFNKMETIQNFLMTYDIRPPQVQEAIDSGSRDKCYEILNTRFNEVYSSIRNIESRTRELQKISA